MKIRLYETGSWLFIFFMNMGFYFSISNFSKYSWGNSVNIGIYILAILFFILHYSCQKGIVFFKKKSFWIYAMLLLVGVLGFIGSRGWTFVKLLFFALGMKGVDYKKNMQALLISSIACVTCITSCSLVGIIPNVYNASGKEGAWSLGFINPNYPGIAITAIVILLVCCFYEHWKGLCVLICSSAVFIWNVVKCRSASGILAMVFILIIIDKLVKPLLKSKVFCFGSKWLFLFCTVITVVIAKLYNHGNAVWFMINKIFSYRLWLYHKYLEELDITLFGNYFEAKQGAADNGYFRLLLFYGVIIYIIYYWIFKMSLASMKENGRTELVICAVVYEVWFLVEFTPMLVNFNPVLIYFFSIFWNDLEKGRRKSDTYKLWMRKRRSSSIQF